MSIHTIKSISLSIVDHGENAAIKLIVDPPLPKDDPEAKLDDNQPCVALAFAILEYVILAQEETKAANELAGTQSNGMRKIPE
jgi:hypothetical protein